MIESGLLATLPGKFDLLQFAYRVGHGVEDATLRIRLENTWMRQIAALGFYLWIFLPLLIL